MIKLLVLVLAFPVLAQQGAGGKIEGTIIDADGAGVPFANIALIDQQTGKTVNGTIADADGKFSIHSIGKGSYKVSITFIGFRTLEKAPFQFTAKGETYQMGKVKMEPDTKELDEVVVEGKRELMEEKIDRLVYNADQDATTAGGDATDVLKRVPLLTVDMDGNVTLRGSSNIKVLIDGRPSTISASSISDALKQIPADQIKTVEVITSPSAKYDAEGTGGIINIITKKNNLQGTSFSVRSSAGFRGSDLGIDASFRKGKMGFTLGGHGRAGYNVTGQFKNKQTLKDENEEIETITYQKANTLQNNLFGRYNLGWDYAINQYNWIGASVQFGVANFISTQDNRTTDTYDASGALSSSSLQDVKTNNLNNSVDANLNYVRTFATKGQELSGIFIYSQSNLTNDSKNIYKDESSDEMTSGVKNNNTGYNREMTFQLDYTQPIGDKHIIEFGAKDIIREVVSDYKYLTAGSDGAYTLSTSSSLTNNFNYNQNVAAGYASYKVQLPSDFNLMAGGRYEYTTINANFSNTDANIPSYGVLVPSVNVSKKLKKGSTLKAAFNRRIQRPSLSYLNPRIDASNPKNISQGNPYLRPEYTNNFEVAYSTFMGGTSLNMSAFARNTNHSIQQVREIEGTDTIYTTYQNIGSQNAYGVSLFANVKISDKFMMNGGLDAYYATLTNNVSDPLFNASNQGMVLSGRMFGDYKFTKKWAFQFFGFFRGRQVQLQGYQTGFYVYSLSLNRSLWDDKGSLGFGVENFVGGHIKMTTDVKTTYIDQYNTNVMNRLNFKINFSWRFGKLTMGDDKKKEKNSESDLKDGGSGGSVY